MKKAVKAILFVGAVLLLLALILGGVALAIGYCGTDHKNTEHEINEEFKNISVTSDFASVVFEASDAGSTVTCYENDSLKHNVKVEDGTLYIEMQDTRKWYEHIGMRFDTPKITVAMPAGEYGTLTVKNKVGNVESSAGHSYSGIDISLTTGNVTNRSSSKGLVKIKASTGNVCIENISAGALDISVTTGAVTVRSVNCEREISHTATTGRMSLDGVGCASFTSNSDTGKISLSDVIAKECVRIDRSTGSVEFDRCDAGEIYVKTDTGNVSGTLLTDKIFLASSDTGKVQVPKTSAGGRCEITTATGGIKIEIAE